MKGLGYLLLENGHQSEQAHQCINLLIWWELDPKYFKKKKKKKRNLSLSLAQDHRYRAHN